MACHFELEKKLLSQYRLIAGVDEVGRGALAGPVVSAMVILDPKRYLDQKSEIDDSKKLSAKKRACLYHEILSSSLAYTISEISNLEIDQTNILIATKKSVFKSYQNISIKPDCLLTDALTIKEIKQPQFSYPKGDSLSYSIAAASILAKFFRDQRMIQFDRDYPEYGFKDHKGYGVKKHLLAIKRYGPSPIHRTTFAPMKNDASLQLKLMGN